MATVFPLLGGTTRMEGEAVEAEAEGRDKRQRSRVGGRDDQHLLPIVMEAVSSNTRPALQDALLKICTLSRQVT